VPGPSSPRCHTWLTPAQATAPNVVLVLVLPIDHLVRQWARESQLGSRRNAMVAATALTRLRIERQDVEDFLASREPVATPRETEVTAQAR